MPMGANFNGLYSFTQNNPSNGFIWTTLTFHYTPLALDLHVYVKQLMPDLHTVPCDSCSSDCDTKPETSSCPAALDMSHLHQYPQPATDEQWYLHTCYAISNTSTKSLQIQLVTCKIVLHKQRNFQWQTIILQSTLCCLLPWLRLLEYTYGRTPQKLQINNYTINESSVINFH